MGQGWGASTLRALTNTPMRWKLAKQFLPQIKHGRAPQVIIAPETAPMLGFDKRNPLSLRSPHTAN